MIARSLPAAATAYRAERGPSGDFALRLEAGSRLDDDEKTVVLALIESMLLRHDARRLTPPRATVQ